MDSIFLAGAGLLMIVALFGAWHGIQALRLGSISSSESRRILRLAAWNLLEPLLSTLIAVPFVVWGLAWTFNCGMNGSRGCNKILTGVIWLVPFIMPTVLLLVPAFSQRKSMLEPWQSLKTRIIQLGLMRFGLIILSCIGFFFAYVNYFVIGAGFVFLIYSLLEVNNIVVSQKITTKNLELPNM